MQRFLSPIAFSVFCKIDILIWKVAQKIVGAFRSAGPESRNHVQRFACTRDCDVERISGDPVHVYVVEANHDDVVSRETFRTHNSHQFNG